MQAIKIKSSNIIYATLALLLGTTMVLAPLLTQKAGALSGSEFKAGRIMDDSVFFNGSSMSTSQIQQFMNAKRPDCDTNGQKTIYDPERGDTVTRKVYAERRGVSTPFTCLKDYKQDTPSKAATSFCKAYTGGTKSSAQIINDVSQSCGVSQKVLLILLQKEQSLVTDDWPWPIQYRSATGYGCPDTAPCDAEYYGFFNQIYMAARVYKYYAAYPNSFNHIAGRDNYVLYNPNHSCGGTNVYIENQTTAGLYNYTPYQPNAAALNNLYGTGDGCSAYGNRNFWRMYNDWFGSTLGSLIRTTSSPTLYYTDGKNKFAIPSMSIAEQYGLGLADVRYVTQQQMDATPLASSPLSPSLGQIVKSDDDSDTDGGTVYLVSRGYRIPISSMGQFTNFGFTTDKIHYLPLGSIMRLLPAPNNLSSFIKGSSPTVYKMEGGKKRIIFELSKLSQENPSGEISKLSDFTLTNWGYGSPLVDGDYVLKDSNKNIRVYRGGNYFGVGSMSIYDCWNLGTVKAYTVSSYSMASGSSQGMLSCVAEESNGSAHIMAKTQRLTLPVGHGLNTSKTSDALIQRLPATALKPVIKGSTATLAVLEGGKKRPIPTMQVFKDLGYSSENISNIPDVAFIAIPSGALKLSVGSLMKESDGKISVIDSPSSRLTIPSVGRFTAYGFNWDALIKGTDTEAGAYPSSSSLPYIVKTADSTLCIVDSGIRYTVSSDQDVHFNINRTNTLVIDGKVLKYTSSKNMTRFIKSSSSSTVYYMENGYRRPVSTWSKLVELGGSDNIVELSDALVNSYPVGPTI